MNEIFVTNKNDFHHSDFYNGTEYDFPPGETVVVPTAAAVHMLGLGRKDKTENLIRLGWANLQGDEGAKRLAKFVFTEGVLVQRPVEESQVVEVEQ